MKEQNLTPEQERFMQWLEADDVQGHSFADGGGGVPADWLAERQAVEDLGQLLRCHLSAGVEMPSAASFNETLRSRLAE